ncbi:hypothetical protein BDR22DRAFT_850150 [Usnea florida]
MLREIFARASSHSNLFAHLRNSNLPSRQAERLLLETLDMIFCCKKLLWVCLMCTF